MMVEGRAYFDLIFQSNGYLCDFFWIHHWTHSLAISGQQGSLLSCLACSVEA